MNDPVSKTIVSDPERFPLIRRMFELMLGGSCTAMQIARMARDEWGFRTPKKKRMGGKPLALCSVYRILANPFYAGVIRWGGATYAGNHEPVVTLDEFERVRQLMQLPDKPKPQRYAFAYTGLIHCGACGLAVTAEHKTKPSGRRYLYYHCSRGRPLERCREPSVEIHSLEQQIISFLRSLEIQPDIAKWIDEELCSNHITKRAFDEAQRASLTRALDNVAKELRELTGLRLRRLLTDEEFVRERERLQSEERGLKARTLDRDSRRDPIEPVRNVVALCKQAADWFERADTDTRRLILKTVSSNPALKGKRLSIQAAKPFIALPIPDNCRSLRRRRDSNSRCLATCHLSKVVE